MEIELKLACETDGLALFEKKVIPLLESQGASLTKESFELLNEYYDTPSQDFGKRKMGFRVRCKDGHYEQTVKTKGQVHGGLHQRPEYNIDLSSAVPDLTLFDADIWGDNFHVSRVNKELEALFSTDFHRTSFSIEQNGSHVELVFDVGIVKRQLESQEICEIELELVEGEISDLFNIARTLIKHVSCRLSNVTKAERGYQLLHGQDLDIKSLPEFLPLKQNDTTEAAFCKTLQTALAHWQRHQYIYSQTNKLKALNEVRESVMLLLQGVSLYLPVLQCKELLQLHKNLIKLTQAWSWQEQIKSIHQLRSKKGPFCKRLPRSQSLMNYLMGRREGLLNAHKPHSLNMSEQSASVQLDASRILYEKPWRQQNSGADIDVKKHANGWLSQTWQTVLQSLPSSNAMDEKQYLALEVILRQSLLNGFLLADLFADSRGQFRAPWLDLASGIDELKAIKLLYDALENVEFEDKLEFKAWVEDKTHSIINVMERTREVAMNAETYW